MIALQRISRPALRDHLARRRRRTCVCMTASYDRHSSDSVDLPRTFRGVPVLVRESRPFNCWRTPSAASRGSRPRQVVLILLSRNARQLSCQNKRLCQENRTCSRPSWAPSAPAAAPQPPTHFPDRLLQDPCILLLGSIPTRALVVPVRSVRLGVSAVHRYEAQPGSFGTHWKRQGTGIWA